MLPKKFRLHKERDIKTVFSRGRAFTSPYFLVRFLIKPKQLLPRLTVVASTKVDKRAVVRNRLKRLVRATLASFLSILPSGDWVIILRPPVGKAKEADFLESLTVFLKKWQ